MVKEYHRFNTGWFVKDTIEYSVYNNKKDTFDNRIFRKGKGIIFTYTAHYDCPNMYDEEQTDALTWSIPDSSTSFKIILSKDNFDLPNFFYKLHQFGYNRPKPMLSATGEITGVKDGENWKISGSLVVIAGHKNSEFTQTRDINFSKVFTQTVYSGPKRKKKYADNYPFYYEKN